MEYVVLFKRDPKVRETFEGQRKAKMFYNATINGLEEDVALDGTPIYSLFLESNPIVYLANKIYCRNLATIIRCK